MLTRPFAAYMKILRKYVRFCATYSRAFQDSLSALDALSNARLIYHIIDPATVDSYFTLISYDVQKTAPSYLGIFQPMCNCYMEPLVFFITSAYKLLANTYFTEACFFKFLCHYTASHGASIHRYRYVLRKYEYSY